MGQNGDLTNTDTPPFTVEKVGPPLFPQKTCPIHQSGNNWMQKYILITYSLQFGIGGYDFIPNGTQK